MTHVTAPQLDRLARRELSVDELRGIEDHLSRCASCAGQARERAASSRAALRRHFLEKSSAVPARWLRRRWIAAAAAAAVVLVTLVALLVGRTSRPQLPGVDARREAGGTPAPRTAVPVAQARSEWDEIVEQTTETGRLPIPGDLAALHRSRDVIRGGDEGAGEVRPFGRVVAEARPRFSWPAREDAAYVVFVFDDDREIARSAVLRETHWTPGRDLPRGRNLVWQVEATRGDSIETIPRPPAPPAVFRIASERDVRDLARAREARPHDHLLHGILYARAGMLDEAASSLRRASATDAAAVKLLESLRRIE